MRQKTLWMRTVSLFIAALLALPLPSLAQNGSDTSLKQPFSKEELAQLVAPIALYPDELIAQVLIASTYPLEIVQADRWVQQNKDLKGDALARALESQNWDTSVKSLVNFPTVLSMMSQKLDLTSRLGDAFLSQEKDVMDTIQYLRKRAYDTGTLKSTPEQKVVVEKETIVIQPSNPEVVYVPTYDPMVVYGTWLYPAYPPYYYYPPPFGYPPFYFATGIAVGIAWGYAWGSCNWYGGSVNVNVWRNTSINNAHINRNAYVSHYQSRGMIGQNGQGQWRHDPSHRRGVAYANPATAQRFGQSPARATQYGRDVRGYGQPSPYMRGGAAQTSRTPANHGAAPSGAAGSGGARPATPAVGPRGTGGGVGRTDRAGTTPSATATPAGRPAQTGVTPPGSAGAGGAGSARPTVAPGSAGGGTGALDRTAVQPRGGRDSAFSGGFGDGASARSASDRGRSSRQSTVSPPSFSGSSRPSGGYGGSAPQYRGGAQPSGGGFNSGGARGGGGGHGGGGYRR